MQGKPAKKRNNLFVVPGATEAAAVPDGDTADFEVERCPICLGTGMEIVSGKGARLCSCRRMDHLSNPFERARVPRRYAGCHFTKYKPENTSQVAAVKFAMKFTNEFPAVDQGLIFMGPVGVGKTHLAVSILKGLAERGFQCLFYDFGALLKEIQDSYNPRTQSSELGVLAPVLNTEVLVLDELGASKPTDWVRDTMAYIINKRYNDSRTTLFTTNYLDSPPNDREESLEERIGMRLRSRLFEMCRTVEIAGSDFRRRIYAKGRPE